jgi:hypothetical protein
VYFTRLTQRLLGLVVLGRLGYACPAVSWPSKAMSKGVHRALPAVAPAHAALAGGVQGQGGQIEALEGGEFVGEVP